MRSSRTIKHAANLLFRHTWHNLNPHLRSVTHGSLKQSPLPFVSPGSHSQHLCSSPFRHLPHSLPRLLLGQMRAGGHWKEASRVTQAGVTRLGVSQAAAGTRSYNQLGPTLQQRLRIAYRNSGGGNPENVVYGLIGANCVVYAMWHMTRDPYFMARHFLVSVESLQNGRWHTAITSAFSHRETGHLFVNMMGLYFFGTEMARYYGPGRLLGLYLAAGVVGSIAHVLYSKYLVPWREGIPLRYFNPLSTPPALGASAATNAIILLNTLMYPRRIVYLNLLIPVPAAILAAFFIGQDLVGVFQEGSRTAHAGHLGGALVGAVFWARYRYRR